MFGVSVRLRAMFRVKFMAVGSVRFMFGVSVKLRAMFRVRFMCLVSVR